MESDVRLALADAAALLALNPRDVRPASEELISLACDALVAGLVTPALCELAAASYASDYWDLRDVIERTLLELDQQELPTDEVQLQERAARAIARRLLGGLMTGREAAQWAHRRIGHDGAPSVQQLVVLDDRFDCLGYGAETEGDLEAEARELARQLLGHDS
ncbi:MAG: hypothetical protein KC492_18605 [Myxococcales bacterium]|nr:hypothetical protein [Myxococcales bacterium]